jgi:hypothetical protein
LDRSGPRRLAYVRAVSDVDVERLQASLNRFTNRWLENVAPLIVDGEKGFLTNRRIMTVKWYLGYLGERDGRVTSKFSAGCATREIRAGRRRGRCYGASAGAGASAAGRSRISIRGRGFRASTGARWRPGCAVIWCGLVSMAGAASSFRAGARRSAASSCASRYAAGRPVPPAAPGALRTTRRRRSRVGRSTCRTTPGSAR